MARPVVDHAHPPATGVADGRAGFRARSGADVLAFVRSVAPEARWATGPEARWAAGPEAHRTAGAAVTGLTLDSGAVRPGDLFAGLPGARGHGADWAGAAARAGAVLLLSDRPSVELPTIVVADPRAVLGPLAAWLHDHPSAGLAVHGVTGTNGKTSTAHLLAAGLEAAGRTTGLAGSLEVRAPGHAEPATRTTAEAPVLQEHLARCRDAGTTDVVLEVSSHGLALGRVAGTRFRTAVFTNLSADHLDLHGDLESYYRAKASLFMPARCDLAVVVVDDPWGRRLAGETRSEVVTVSAAGHDADWRVGDVTATGRGTAFRLAGPGVDREVHLGLLGAHQAANAAAAIAALVSTGVDPDAAVRGVAGLRALPGRLERVDEGQPFLALVDFAHNVGGHRRLLPFLRSLTADRLVVVLGATGDRDPGKRAALGRCVAEEADVVVVTDESPHSEDPGQLRAAVAAGVRSAGGAELLVQPGRAAGIARAVAVAGPSDVLVVVGRGADPILVEGSRRRPFDDRDVLRRALRARGTGSA